jgi:nicotinamidase-related amidase
MVKPRTVLVVIDPQNCFMDIEGAPLQVPGALADMRRLGYLLDYYAKSIHEIIVSLDTHVPDHISHAARWVDAGGNHPAPFTVITHEECLAGIWRATNPADQAWQLEYLRLLKRPHVIWPVHGQKPSWEWQVYEDLSPALDRHCNVRYIEKGMHRDVEQFGIFGAEVPYPGASETDINHNLIEHIDSYDHVIFAGEAASHCVMDSVKQFLAHAPSQDAKKVSVLKDCMSPVGGFEQLVSEWFENLKNQGVQVVYWGSSHLSFSDSQKS